MEPQLIERDGSLFVVNKPAGLPVHPTADKAELSLTKWIRDTFGHDVAPIHRLDRDTSGVVLLSSDREERAAWGRTFASGHVEKVYLAYVFGRLAPEGIINRALYDQRRRRRLPAETHYEMQRCYADCAYVAIAPHSGRKHQIRKHFAGIGHPILGDPRYPADRRQIEHAWSAPCGLAKEIAPRRRLWLHAHTLVTTHGMFCAEEPDTFVQFGAALATRDQQLD